MSASRGSRQLGILWAGVVIGLIALSPLGGLFAERLPPCPLKTITGVPCPTCGLTRAALDLARFEPLHALIHYPLPTIAWLSFLLGGLGAGLLVLLDRPLPSLPKPVPLWLRAGAVVALLGNWVFNIVTGV